MESTRNKKPNRHRLVKCLKRSFYGGTLDKEGRLGKMLETLQALVKIVG